MNKIKENLIDLFGLDKLPPEKMVEMIERLSKMIFQSILMRVVPLLDEKDLEEYEKIVENNQGGEVLLTFLQTKVPNFDEIVAEESDALYKELSGEMKEAGIE